jgi:hypothetical protein
MGGIFMKDMNYCLLPDGGQHKPMCPKTGQAQLAAAERQIKELRWSLKMQTAIKSRYSSEIVELRARIEALEHGRKR